MHAISVEAGTPTPPWALERVRRRCQLLRDLGTSMDAAHNLRDGGPEVDLELPVLIADVESSTSSIGELNPHESG